MEVMNYSGREEGNIGGLRIEDLQQKWPMAAALWYKTDSHDLLSIRWAPGERPELMQLD